MNPEIRRKPAKISYDAVIDRSYEIRFDRPRLPDFLERLRVRCLQLGDAEVDVLFRRFGSEVAATVTRRSGAVRVVVVQ